MTKYYRKDKSKALVTSPVLNSHILNIVYALDKNRILEAFCTAVADNYSLWFANKLRRLLTKISPSLDINLNKRKINNLSNSKVYKYPLWEILRVISRKLFSQPRITDFFWEKGDHHLDKQSRRLIQKEKFNLFLGVEHSCLETLIAAKKKEKKTVLIFLSPHHSFFKKWVIPEYNKFPELMDTETKELIKLSEIRDRRRDKEAQLADIICTNSKVVTNSLLEAGFLKRKIMTVPLGAPVPNLKHKQIRPSKKKFSFIYAGPFSVHKGAHYLLKAWNDFSQTDTELHVYGENLLPKKLFVKSKKNIYFHGSILQKDLFSEFKKANILVFPTLCDGFGMVAFEAMACGLPVITTKNAGVSQFIEEGKNGFLVPPADSKSLKEKMSWCMNNPGKINQMRKEALKTAEGRNWEDFQKDFIKKLKEKLTDEKET